MVASGSMNSVKLGINLAEKWHFLLLNKGNLGPDFIHLETNLEESRGILVLLGNIVQTNEQFDFRFFLSAIWSFHWSLVERAGKKRRNSLYKSRSLGLSVT